jgi:hypothetical protein
MGINESPGGPSIFPSSRISSVHPADLFSLDDALHRAHGDALGRVIVPFALNACSLVNHIQNAIALADRLGGAFRNAGATGDALFVDFHGHGMLLL